MKFLDRLDLAAARRIFTRGTRGVGLPHKQAEPGATPGPATLPPGPESGDRKEPAGLQSFPGIAPGLGVAKSWLIVPRGPVFVRVCSWCQTVIGVKSTEGGERTRLTHGVCEECAADWGKDAA